MKTFPEIDATRQAGLTDEQAQFFRDHGLLVIRNVLRGAELQAMQDETLPLVHRAMRERVNDPDFLYTKHPMTGQETPFRIEFILEKTQAGKALLAHPFILRSVEKLQGRNFIPTWDSLVFKTEGAGAAIPWHRDAGMECCGPAPIFNVDFYLDASDLTNCLWGILGSNLWSDAQAQARLQQLNRDGFQTDADCVPIPLQPGDVIFHNILALHGSPAAQTKLRRVVYYEFRPAEIEARLGPHRPDYIPVKQRVLLSCLRQRAAAWPDETPFVYRPDAEFAPPEFDANRPLDTYRHPHQEYWRKAS